MFLSLGMRSRQVFRAVLYPGALLIIPLARDLAEEPCSTFPWWRKAQPINDLPIGSLCTNAKQTSFESRWARRALWSLQPFIAWDS